MIPHLALTLSFDGIGLTRQSPDGWEQVGHVALDAPDLADRLHALRDTAAALCPDGIATAVVLPDEQILNRHLPGVAEAPAAVAAALDGLTPYAVADLVFDWRPHPESGVVVAAVARETIDEALAFARQYGFNPVALTARPAAGLPFAAEPDFGPAPADATIDATAYASVAAVEPPPAPAAPTVADGTTPDALGTIATDPAGESRPDIGADNLTWADPDVAPTVPGSEGFATRRGRAPLHLGSGPDSPGTEPFLLEPEDKAAQGQPDDAAIDPSARIAARPARLTALAPASPTMEATADPAAPTEPPQPDQVAAPAENASGRGEAAGEGDGPASGTGQAAPANNRERAVDAPTETLVPDTVPVAKVDGAPAVPARKSADTAPATRLVTATRNGATSVGRSGSASRQVGAVRRAGGVKPGIGGTGTRGTKSAGTPPPLRTGTDTGPARLAEPSPSARSAAATLSVRALGDPTLAGSPRGMTSMPVVVGLVAALLIALAAAVGLSRVVIGWLAPPTDLATISADAPMVAVVSVPEPTVEPAPTDVLPDVAQTLPRDDSVPSAALPDVPAPDRATVLAPDLPDTVQSPLPEGAVAPASVDPSSPAQVGTSPPAAASAPPAIVAETDRVPGPATGFGIVPRLSADTLAVPPPAPARLSPPDGTDALPQVPSQFVLGPGPAPVVDPERPVPVLAPLGATFVLSSADPAVALQDPLALVAPSAGAARDLPEVQPLPPPGVTYRLDDRGLVVATTEGALAPEGHLVTLGRPALVPPARPLTATPAPAVATDPSAVLRLARLRPPPRPDAVQPAPVTDGAAAVPPVSPSVDLATGGVPAAVAEALSAARTPDDATVRPLPRPAALSSAAVSVPTDAPPDPSPEVFASATERAIPVSLRPATRPAGLDAIAAAAAVRIAPLPPAEADAPTSAAPRQEFDYDDGEPEVASAAPQIPSSASVARQATVESALNLRELNLIGVYGTASDRRALVRLPNGRFVKVEIGDRVDGGQVADIGDRDLRYVKGGRSFVLSMPRG